MTDTVKNFPVSECTPHPLNRKRLGELAELVEDIRENGVEVPLIGRHLEGKVQILAGARRLQASIEAGKSDVPVILRDLDDNEAFRFLVRENLHRENVHALDEADYFAHLAEDHAFTPEMIAVAIGKSETYVHQRYNLRSLIPSLRNLLEQRKLSVSAALLCAVLPTNTQNAIAGRLQSHLEMVSKVSPKFVRREIERYALVLTLSSAAFSPKDADLWPAAGACLDCPKRTGSSPSLFGDISQHDACTDPKCFEQKSLKQLDRRVKQFQEEGVEWVPVTRDYLERNFAGKRVLSRYLWVECRAKDPGAIRAVTVEPHNGQHHSGHTLWVQLKRDQTFSSYKQSPVEQAARRRQLRAQKVKKLERKLLFKAVADREKPPKTAEEFRRLARAMWSRIWHEGQKKIATTLGWELVKTKSAFGSQQVNMKATGYKQIDAMNGEECLRLMSVLCVASDIDHSEYFTGPDQLAERAKQIGIDLDEIRKRAQDSIPRPKAKPATEKKKTTTRKKAPVKG